LKIQPIVEGHGEVSAVPILLRRLRDVSGAQNIDFLRPIRRKRSELVTEAALRKSVRVALLQDGCTGILILLDGDDDCPGELGPRIQGWATDEARMIACAVVIASTEYEAWFLSSLESLRGRRGIRADAVSHPTPESVRGAKENLEENMDKPSGYIETTDQAALTALFDFAPAHQKCRSFRRLVKAFGIVASGGQGLPGSWPPPTW
jgi:hypothetical protein